MKQRLFAIMLAAVMMALMLPQAALAAGNITVSINGATPAEYASLEAAITASGVQLANITSIAFTGGEVESEDWNYIKDNKRTLSSLTTLTVTDGVKSAADPAGDLLSIPGDETPKSPITYANIAKVGGIGLNAFFCCASLSTASFPAATSIGRFAFFKCTALATANFPAVTIIDDNAFVGCTALATVNFPSVEEIHDSAFIDCSALATANFPAVIRIVGYAFLRCSKLASLSLPAAPPTVEAGAFDGCPATRYLTLVDASGAALTGQTLSNAITAYKTHAGYDAATNKWYGWSLPAQATAPSITTQPAAKSVIEGNSATFAVEATGSEPIAYQWQYSTDGGATWQDVSGGSGATSASYTTDATTMAMNGYQYRCVVSTGVLPDATSSAATLFVLAQTNTVTVTGGTGGGEYASGDTVVITAGPAPAGQQFKEWSIDSIVDFADGTSVLSATVKLIMPTRDVIVTATYEPIPVPPAPVPPIDPPEPPTIPKTGDASTPALWWGMLAAGLGGLAACVAARRRKRRS